MPAPIRTRDAARTKANLIGEARHLFASFGFEGVRTQQIAAAAGVNKAMINYYFGGKQGLYSAIIEKDVRTVMSVVTEPQPDHISPAERLDRFIVALSAAIERNPSFLFILVREQMSGSEHLEPAARTAFLGFFEWVQDILNDGMASGAFRDLEPHMTHISLVGSLVYFLLTQPGRHVLLKDEAVEMSNPDWPDYVEHIRALFRKGLA